MVKPDVKVNYYASLELGPDASIEEIKKQYRKLALKCHPDRNPGKEEECIPKFQAISAAHEILSDPATKDRYDADRRRANLTAGAPPRAAASGTRGNPYAATSSFAPPPRRTADPTGWTRKPHGAASNTGADRFTNFPGPSPTSRTSETRKTTASEAWSAMGGGRQPQSRPVPNPPPRHAPPPTTHQRHAPPPPPVPPRDPGPPPRREEEIRAGMSYRQAPTGFQSSAYAHYNNTPSSPTSARPNLSRSNTARGQARHGYDPTTSGSDEAQTTGPSGYNVRFKDNQSRPAPSTQPAYTASADDLRGSFGTSRPRPKSMPHPHPSPPGLNRVASTYHHVGGEKTYFSSEKLRRTQSSQNTAGLDSRGGGPSAPHRPRSSSPYGNPPKKNEFDLGTESGSSSDSASSADSAPERANTFSSRKKNVPRSRMNSAKAAGHRQPEQGQDQNMYDGYFSSHSTEEVDSDVAWHTVFPFRSVSSATNARHESVPSWAIPSTVRIKNTSKQGTYRCEAHDDDDIPFEPDEILIDISPEHKTSTLRTKHERDMLELQSDFVGFTSPFVFSNAASSQSKRTEDINTAFSPISGLPNFTGTPITEVPAFSPSTGRKGSPARRHNLSARSSQTHFNSKGEGTGAANPPLFGEIPTTKTTGAEANAERTFSPDQWANHNFFQASPPGPPQVPSNTQEPPAAQGTEIPGAGQPNGDAMDIDPEPLQSEPNTQQATAQSVSEPPPPQSASTVLPSLDPLAETLSPGSSEQGPGLSNFTTFHNSIPFTSRAAPSHPSNILDPSRTTTYQPPALPSIPTAPPTPQRLSTTSWKNYTATVSAYLTAYHRLQEQLANHALDHAEYEARLLGTGPAGLEAQGQVQGVSVEVYKDRCRGMERWAELASLAAGKHVRAVEEYVRVKMRVRALVEGPGLPE